MWARSDEVGLKDCMYLRWDMGGNAPSPASGLGA